MLFAPTERDLPQCFGAELKPSRLDLVPPKGVLEMPECTCAVNSVQQILPSSVGRHRIRKVLHDRPLVDVELGGKLLEPISRNNSLGDLPFLLLPSGKVRLLADRLVCLAQKIIRHGLDVAGVQIQERRRLVELHLQRVDDLLQENNRGHI